MIGKMKVPPTEMWKAVGGGDLGWREELEFSLNIPRIGCLLDILLKMHSWVAE